MKDIQEAQTPCTSYTGRPRVHAKPIIFLHLSRRQDINIYNTNNQNIYVLGH
jgi:hypothetical protein